MGTAYSVLVSGMFMAGIGGLLALTSVYTYMKIRASNK